MKRRRQSFQRERSFDRRERVAEFIRTTLSELLRNKVRDPRLANAPLTLTEVKVSRDLAYADIFVACYSETEDLNTKELLAHLDRASGFLRTELAQRHEMRTTPELRFKYDSTHDQASRIDELLSKVRYS